MEMYELRLKFQWNLFLGFQLTLSTIGLDNGLTTTRRQSIIWTNEGWFTVSYMRRSLSMSQLTRKSLDCEIGY